MGVVSGIVMSYQFGTNWSVFSDKAGPVLGPLMGYEVLTAFFLEAGFLGVMLFGRSRVGPRLHFLATLMVALGTFISAFWILSVNSWMQTPAGYAISADGQFFPADWGAIVFNPSFPYRLVHMLLAAYLTTAFVVGGTGALHLLRDSTLPASRIMFSMAMWMAALVAPLQIVAGDFHGLNTLEHQPAKVAAMEGHYETHAGAPLILFGWPDMEQERTRYAVAIPRLGSLILTHDLNGTVRGLKEWPREDRPNATIVFWSFRVMVGAGLAMLAVGIWSLALRAPSACTSSRGCRVRPSRLVPSHRRGARGLVHDGGRPPALHGLRAAANSRERIIERGRARARRSRPTRRLPLRVRRRLRSTCCA